MEANSFLNFYEMHGDYLIDADPETGRPYLAIGEKDGQSLLIKFWPRRAEVDDSDLEDIWLHELRQLHRLKGYPGVGDYISTIVDYGRDNRGFYLVLDTSGRIPLTCLTRTQSTLTLRTHWLKRIKYEKNRLLFWSNIKRIVKAIDLLHAQGLLHRHLDSNSILSSADISNETVDFQLTGFEWSVRVHAMSSAPSNGNWPPPSGSFYSFATDWNDLGVLLGTLLGVDVRILEKPIESFSTLVVKTGLMIDELHLIRALIGLAPIGANTQHEIINAKSVEKSIERIVDALSKISSTQKTSYRIAINLRYENRARGNQHSLKSAVQAKYKEKFDVTITESDYEEMKRYIIQDLSDSPVVIFPTTENTVGECVYIKGKELIYRLEKFQLSHEDSAYSWDFAFCQKAYIHIPSEIHGSPKIQELNSSNIEIYAVGDARHLHRSSPNEAQSNSWVNVINSVNEPESAFSPSQLALIEGLSACHLTEICYAKSEIYPVDIFETKVVEHEERRVSVTSSYNEDAEALSKAMMLEAPAIRLKKALSNNDGEIETLTWSLVNSSLLSKENGEEIILSFQECEIREDGQAKYTFTTTQAIPCFKQYFIAPNSLQGTFRQLSRRSKALDHLSTHIELVETLSNPQRNAYKTQDSIVENESYSLLDESKQAALEKILKTNPIFLVQGPPGVGKTYLVKALIEQIFEKEPDARLLLSAQSHATVQHLYHEVDALKKNIESEKLVIRCNKQDSDDETSISDADAKAREFLDKLIDSDLFKNSTSNVLKSKIIEMSQGYKSNRYTLVNQLLRSANMVFSTTNSEQIERLIRDRAQFDWSIMEETGKATGVELLSPLLLSHRRLMIGDHKQLPPYRSNEIMKILLDPSRLRAVLKEVDQVQNPKIRSEVCKTVLEDNELSEKRLIEIGANGAKTLMLFEQLVTNEEKESNAYEKAFGSIANRTPVGSMLKLQHRMHPHIAELISEVFYKNNLKTHPDKESYFLSEDTLKPFHFIPSIGIDMVPSIIWVNMPDLQTTKGMKTGDQFPRWHNPQECKTIINILKTIRVNPSVQKNPKLAVLSPYAEQVKRIESVLKRKIPGDKFLSNLDSFSKPDDHASFCSTVDAFQGCEADIVIVSLVRNNDKGTSKSALGFLLDERRMNVLLSRSRFQLVLVGSYEFLKSWSESISKIGLENQEGDFLVRLVKKFEEFKKLNRMRIVPFSEFDNR